MTLPAVTSDPNHVLVKVNNAKTFKRTIDWLAATADTESSRYALGCLLLRIIDGKLVLVATDGRRLSVATFPTVTQSGLANIKAGCEILIPARKLRDALKTGRDADRKQVTIAIVPSKPEVLKMNATTRKYEVETPKQLGRFSIQVMGLYNRHDTAAVTGEGGDGRFPDWERIMNDNLTASHVASVSGEALTLGEFFAEPSPGLVFSIEKPEGVKTPHYRELTLQPNEPIRKLCGTIPALTITGELPQTTFDRGFLRDALLPFNSRENVTLKFTDSSDSGSEESKLLVCSDPKRIVQATTLIMPLRRN